MKHPTYRRLLKILKQKIQDSAWSEPQLAEYLKTSLPQLQFWLDGEDDMTLPTFLMIAEKVGWNISGLLDPDFFPVLDVNLARCQAYLEASRQQIQQLSKLSPNRSMAPRETPVGEGAEVVDFKAYRERARALAQSWESQEESFVSDESLELIAQGLYSLEQQRNSSGQ